MYRNVQSKVMPPRTPGAPFPVRRPVSVGGPALCSALCLALILPVASFADFNQTDWSGGESTATAADSTDQTGWTRFGNRAADLLIVDAGGDLTIAGAPASVEHTTDADFAFGDTRFTHTTDADFNTGTQFDNVVVTDGSIRLAPGRVSGEYESAVIDLGPHLALTHLQISVQQPPGTKITRRGENPNFPTIGIRGSNDGVTFTQYLEYSSGFILAELFLNRYVQYRVQLDTVDPDITPSLDEVTFTFRNYPDGTGVDVACSAGVSPCDGQVRLMDGANSGTYFSSIIDFGMPRELATLDFDLSTPADTMANVALRAGDLDNPITTAGGAAWTDWQSVAASGNDISGLGMHRYVQYRVELARPSGGASPVLESVRVNYLGNPAAGNEATLTSSRIDSEAEDNRLRSVQWIEALPEGADVRFRVATAPTAGDLAAATFVGPDGTGATYWSSANVPTDGGCFKPTSSSPVTCTGIPAGLRDGVGDRWVAYRVTLIASGDPDPESPTVAEVFLGYGGGAAAGVTVAPVSGLVTTEAGGTAVFSVVLDTAPVDPVIIDFNVGKPDEIALSADSLTFTGADWDESQTVTVTGLDDGVDDDDQLVTISPEVRAGGDAAYAAVDIANVTVINIDDDALTATVAVTDANATEAGPTSGVFTISLNGPAPTAIPVNFSFAGTASFGTDYFASPQSPATIPAGQQSVTVTITPIDDADAEGDETVEITLTGGAGYVLDNARTATLIIIDDETVDQPTVSVARGNADPDEAVGLTGFFTISRTGPVGVDLAVLYTVTGTATPGVDYNDLGNSMIIPAGATNIVLPVTPVDDDLEEGDETVILTIGADVNYLIDPANASATITIIDDETLPQTTIPGGADSDDSSGLGAAGPLGGLILAMIALLAAAGRKRSSSAPGA